MHGTLHLQGDPNVVDYSPLRRLSSLQALSLDILADRCGVLPRLLRALVNPGLTELTINGITSGTLPTCTTSLHALDMPWSLLAAHADQQGRGITMMHAWHSLGGRSFDNVRTLRLVCDLGVRQLASVFRTVQSMPRLQELDLDAWPSVVMSDHRANPSCITYDQDGTAVYGCLYSNLDVESYVGPCEAIVGVCECAECRVRCGALVSSN